VDAVSVFLNIELWVYLYSPKTSSVVIRWPSQFSIRRLGLVKGLPAQFFFFRSKGYMAASARFSQAVFGFPKSPLASAKLRQSQTAKRTCRFFLFVGSDFCQFLLLEQAIPCMNQALPFGLKRKIDKLSKWESQSPADRSPSDHAQRLQSRAGSLGKQSYRKINR
jgi:hypothetical protein